MSRTPRTGARERLDELLASGELHDLARRFEHERELCAELGMAWYAIRDWRQDRNLKRPGSVPTWRELRGGEANHVTDLEYGGRGEIVEVGDDFDDEPTRPGMSIDLPLEPVPSGFEVSSVTTEVDADGNTVAQHIGTRRESTLQTEVHKPIPNGHRVKGVSTYVDGEGKVRGQWIKTDVAREKQREHIIEAIRRMADEWPERVAPPAPDHVDDDLLCIYPMGDPHFGMYAWAAETGDDYDLELAEQYHVAAMEALVRISPPAKHALVIDLGDFFHMDNSSNMTPRSGHVLDVDTRRPKVFRTGVRAFRKLIDLTQEKHERTDVWVVPGNHDQDSSAPMQIALEMYYERNPRVFVDPSPAIALYKRFGDNLIGSTHTHTVRDRMSLGEMMATHRKEDWGQTEHRYWYCGHVHHDSLIETRGGVIVETFRTLAAKDKYAADNNYNSGRDMKCDVIHRIDGRVTRNIIGIRQIKRQLLGASR